MPSDGGIYLIGLDLHGALWAPSIVEAPQHRYVSHYLQYLCGADFARRGGQFSCPVMRQSFVKSCLFEMSFPAKSADTEQGDDG